MVTDRGLWRQTSGSNFLLGGADKPGERVPSSTWLTFILLLDGLYHGTCTECRSQMLREYREKEGVRDYVTTESDQDLKPWAMVEGH